MRWHFCRIRLLWGTLSKTLSIRCPLPLRPGEAFLRDMALALQPPEGAVAADARGGLVSRSFCSTPYSHKCLKPLKGERWNSTTMNNISPRDRLPCRRRLHPVGTRQWRSRSSRVSARSARQQNKTVVVIGMGEAHYAPLNHRHHVSAPLTLARSGVCRGLLANMPASTTAPDHSVPGCFPCARAIAASSASSGQRLAAASNRSPG